MNHGKPIIQGGGSPGAKRNACASRRGFSYVMFLGSATFVVVIGLAASAVVRAELRSVGSEGDAALARAKAINAIEQAEILMYTKPTWRDDYNNDEWSADTAFDEGVFNWKFADDIRGDLKADISAPTRVYGRGVHGDAVAIYSVLMQPPPTPASVLAGTPNLVTNGDFSGDHVAGWGAVGASLIAYSGGPHSKDGSPDMCVYSRSSSASGPTWTFPVPLEQGFRYSVSIEIRTAQFADEVIVGVLIDASGVPFWIPFLEGDATTSWQTFSGSFTADWSGKYVSATLAIASASKNDKLFVDGVTVTRVPENVYGPIPGTWRREAQ